MSAQEVDRDAVPIRFWDGWWKALDMKQVRIRIGPSDKLEDNPVVYDAGKCLKEDWVSEKETAFTIKVAAFDGGKNKLWFKGCNAKGEVVQVLAAECVGAPGATAADKPRVVFAVYQMIYPRRWRSR